MATRINVLPTAIPLYKPSSSGRDVQAFSSWMSWLGLHMLLYLLCSASFMVSIPEAFVALLDKGNLINNPHRR